MFDIRANYRKTASMSTARLALKNEDGYHYAS